MPPAQGPDDEVDEGEGRQHGQPYNPLVHRHVVRGVSLVSVHHLPHDGDKGEGAQQGQGDEDELPRLGQATLVVVVHDPPDHEHPDKTQRAVAEGSGHHSRRDE